MNIDDRHSVSVWADEKEYLDNSDYRSFIDEQIQIRLSKPIMTALSTKGAIVVIEGDTITRKNEFTCGIDCRKDVYVKELVLCKDCKHNNTENCIAYNAYFVQPEDWFCGNGERKDEVK